MVLEFILVHSGGMMASMLSDKDEQANWNQLKLLTGATLFYAIFVAAMAFSFKSWTLFYIFTAVMISRWISFFTMPEYARTIATRRSGSSVVYYLLAVFLSVVIPWPELGVTRDIVNSVYPDRGSGHWERYPQSALAAGVIYFCLLGMTELSLGKIKSGDLRNAKP